MHKVMAGFMAILALGIGVFFLGCKTPPLSSGGKNPTGYCRLCCNKNSTISYSGTVFPGTNCCLCCSEDKDAIHPAYSAVVKPLAKKGKNPTLYVGITPDCPPIIFKKGNQILGLEADLARELAKTLDRPLQFVEVPWEQQINSLLADKFDVIMSGMTVTPERQVRIAFSEPYLLYGKMALVRCADLERFGTSTEIYGAKANFAVQRKTTGDIFVRSVWWGGPPPAASVVNLDPADAVQALRCKTIDIYIHEAPIIVWIASGNEADLTTVPIRSDKKQIIAWGIKKTDADLQTALNKILAQWKQDGTLDRIRQRWLPIGK